MDSRCGSLARLLGAHTDGQLDAAKTLEVDDHLGACETCRERVALDRAIRGSLKKAVKSQNAPTDVRARMLAAMAGQRSREEAQARDDEAATALSSDPIDRPSRPSLIEEASDGGGMSPAGRPVMLRHWRTMLPLASAAAIALAWGFASKQPMALSDGNTAARAGFGNDELVNQFVDVHSRPLRPETPDPKMVSGFEREVGVPVHVPKFENANFVGGRLLPVSGGERVAMVQYDVVPTNGNPHRVTLFIYDPKRVQVGGAPQLPPRAVGTAQVRVGQTRGYSVAIAQHGDVGYAVASDLDVDANAQLVAKANGD